MDNRETPLALMNTDGLFPQPRQPARSGLLFVLSGPSGVGKDTIIAELKRQDLSARFVVTATTRPERIGEQNGVDYHFKTVAEFEAMITGGELLEHARVYNNYYGVPLRPVREQLAAGIDLVLKIDIQGGATVRRRVPEAVGIFVAPVSFEELKQRLIERKSETPEQLAVRLQTAQAELAQLWDYDYLVYNRQSRLEEAVRQIQAIIIAEQCRVHPRTASI